MNTSFGQVMGDLIPGGVSAFRVTWDRRAATRAIFIKSVYRHAGTAFGTRALVDAALDHCISNERRAYNYDREY